MIRLYRRETPLILTPAFVLAGTNKYKQTGEPVWNIDELKECLHRLSNNKCAYCECNVNEESKYMEVEHFEDKHDNPDKVLEWENLLPSCKKCNGSKSTHDVIAEPIINPFTVDPKIHLKIKNYRFKHKTIIGKTTIDVVNLNDSDRAVAKRYAIGEAMHKNIVMAEERLSSFKDKGTTIWKNKLQTIVRELLNECQPESSYAATCATLLHTDETYLHVKDEMNRLGLWTNTHDLLHSISSHLVMDT
ncbi:HNH endonuclease [Hymenobacter terrenus]|uniref:HNH endonuclease n=1 Tax=Hymenobacter terrenus TaxID=1629124 RepID=UPI00090824AB|nr:HNH endonuclease [Hymenobacter terrenus]